MNATIIMVNKDYQCRLHGLLAYCWTQAMEEITWLVGQKHLLGFLGIHIHIAILRPSAKLVDRRLHYTDIMLPNNFW